MRSATKPEPSRAELLAWNAYLAATRDVEPVRYAEVEAHAWRLLQQRLKLIPAR